MLLSQVKQLLDQTLSAENFRNEIAAETNAYEKVYRDKETTIPVYLKEDIYYLFTEEHYRCLDELYNTGKLKTHELSYICDALSLSEMTLYEDDALPAKIEQLVITKL